LESDRREQFLVDMARCGDVLQHEMQAVRVNYAIFGNVEPALHAHLFPRRLDEPAEQLTAQPWALDWRASAPFDSATHGALIERLRQRIRVEIPDSVIPRRD
jgi:diadenosine tetraphosphate (Ap4A) HIT family hydrolase